MKSTIEWASLRHKTLVQWKIDWINSNFNFTNKASSSSKSQWFLFVQSVHNRNMGTRFQTKEECLPKKFLHLDKRWTILLGITHWAPNTKKAKVHNACNISLPKWFLSTWDCHNSESFPKLPSTQRKQLFSEP